ncbi:glycosyltransferase [Vibrio cortegadensis]|uniref:Glycosyltransferase n=1 Tax=Vibrio cortegadensis TaxID=1328770 RepID=A0ABV4M6Y8_9VIBR
MINIFLFSDMRYPHNHSFLNGVLHSKLKANVTEFGINASSKSVFIKRKDSNHLSLGIPGTGFFKRLINYFLVLLNLIPLLFLMKKNGCDVIFVRNDPIFSLVALIYKKLSCKKIMIIYQLSHLKEEQLLCRPDIGSFSKLTVLLSRKVRNYIILSVDEVFFISHEMKEVIRKQLTSDFNINYHIFGLGMSLDWGGHKNKSKNFKGYAIYVGTLDSSRSMDVTIDAYIEAYEQKKLSIPLYIVGGDKNFQDKRKLQFIVRERNAEAIIKFIPTCDRLECYDYIYNAKFAICTFSDSVINRTISPTKLFEYMFFNVPVLCSNGNSVVENVLYNSKFGFISDFSKENIIKDLALIDRFSSDNEGSKLGYEYIKKNHNYDVMADRVMNIIRENFRD